MAAPTALSSSTVQRVTSDASLGGGAGACDACDAAPPPAPLLVGSRCEKSQPLESSRAAAAPLMPPARGLPLGVGAKGCCCTRGTAALPLPPRMDMGVVGAGWQKPSSRPDGPVGRGGGSPCARGTQAAQHQLHVSSCNNLNRQARGRVTRTIARRRDVNSSASTPLNWCGSAVSRNV
jgi:hypothetical protein